MIENAILVGKPVFTATQMLESEIKAPSPTKAEVGDVKNIFWTAVIESYSLVKTQTVTILLMQLPLWQNLALKLR